MPKNTPNKKGKQPLPTPAPISEKQWNMPAGYTKRDSKMLTLREYVQAQEPVLELDELTQAQISELTIRRLQQLDDYSIYVLRGNRQVRFNRDDAIAAMRSDGKDDRFFCGFEKGLLRELIDTARKT